MTVTVIPPTLTTAAAPAAVRPTGSQTVHAAGATVSGCMAIKAGPCTAFASALLLAGLGLPGCSRLSVGEVDPPQPNPKPVERVILHVIAPPTLEVRLAASYQIGTGLSAYDGRRPCGAASAPPATTTVPIDLRWDGRAYAGEFLIDRFLAGRCEWTFARLETLSPARDFVSLYQDSMAKYNFDATHNEGVYAQSPAQSADLWCAPDPAPNGEGKMVCTSLQYFQLYPGFVDPKLLASVSAEARAHNPLVHILPSIRSITLRYHDLALENREASSALGR